VYMWYLIFTVHVVPEKVCTITNVMWINCLLIFTSWYGTCCRCGNVGGFFAAVAAEHG
jgi:hypothetical protein